VTGAYEQETSAVRTWKVSGNQTFLNIDGTPLILLDEVLVRLSDLSHPNAIFSLFNVATWAVQPRISGFGGPGMTTYIGKDTTFSGRLEGDLDLSAANLLRPQLTFAYQGLEDLSGANATGAQSQEARADGSGYLYGSLRVLFTPLFDLGIIGAAAPSGPYTSAPILDVEVVYGDADGDPAIYFQGRNMVSGTYTMTVNGTSFSPDFTRGFSPDISQWLRQDLEANGITVPSP